VTVHRALKELHVGNPMVQAENGEEALAYPTLQCQLWP
jgi:hypothetical protein